MFQNLSNHYMKPILVHVHIFYAELWPELKLCLSNISEYPYELYVTMVQENETLVNEIQATKPNAHILIVKNKGYDVGPFIHVLQQINLQDYSYIIKLHTKRNIEHISEPGWTYYSPYYLKGALWREYLLSFLQNGNLEKCLKAFDETPSLGMVNNYRLIVPEFHRKEKTLCTLQERAFKLLNQVGLYPRNSTYVKGTMFIVRAHLMQKIKNLGLSIDSFPAPDASHAENLAHELEIALGTSVAAQNYDIRDVFTPDVESKMKWGTILGRLRRKLYKNYISPKGRHVVKIAHILVWNAKVAK